MIELEIAKGSAYPHWITEAIRAFEEVLRQLRSPLNCSKKLVKRTPDF
jgi:hypothetical protein